MGGDVDRVAVPDPGNHSVIVGVGRINVHICPRRTKSLL
jgi:hypothetical protein